MSWDTSIVSGPWPIPIYGDPAPETDPLSGQSVTVTPITGDEPGYCMVLPTARLTDAMAAYVRTPFPAGVPVLAGVESTALVFPDQATAQSVLAAYWRADD